MSTSAALAERILKHSGIDIMSLKNNNDMKELYNAHDTFHVAVACAQKDRASLIAKLSNKDDRKGIPKDNDVCMGLLIDDYTEFICDHNNALIGYVYPAIEALKKKQNQRRF